MLKGICRTDLRDILNGSKGTGHHSEKIGPEWQLPWEGDGKYPSYGDDEQAMDKAAGAHKDGCPPVRLLLS